MHTQFLWEHLLHSGNWKLRQTLKDNVKLMPPTEVGCEDGRWMELTLYCFCDSHVASVSSVTRETYIVNMVMPHFSYRAVQSYSIVEDVIFYV